MTHGAAFWFHCVFGGHSAPAPVGSRRPPGLPARCRAGGGRGRRSCRCPIATTCGSASRPRTARTRVRGWPTSCAISSGAGPRVTPAAAVRLSGDCRRGAGAVRRYTLAAREVVIRGPGAPTQRQLRAALRRLVAARGRAGAEGEGRDRPPQRRRVPLRAPHRPGAHRHPAGALRPRALPGDRAAVAARGLRPRRSSVPVLRQRGREPRPRAAALARRAAHVGERRGLVPVVQRAARRRGCRTSAAWCCAGRRSPRTRPRR